MTPKFSLQNVLDVRHSKVESLEIALGQLVAALAEARERVDALHRYETVLMETLASQMQGDMDLFTIARLQQDIKDTGRAIVEAEQAAARLAAAVEAMRKELVVARQGEEALGILKNKMIEAYNSEQAQKEAHMMDEIYIARAFRGQMQAADAA